MQCVTLCVACRLQFVFGPAGDLFLVTPPGCLRPGLPAWLGVDIPCIGEEAARALLAETDPHAFDLFGAVDLMHLVSSHCQIKVGEGSVGQVLL